MRFGSLIIVFALLSCQHVFAQQQSIKPKKPIVCYGSGIDEHTILEASEKYKQWLQNPTTRVKTATFEVTYSGFTEQAKDAFQTAVDIWSTIITSTQTIKIKAEWTPLATGLLGSAIWGSAYSDFKGAPKTHTYYPVALAEKIAHMDLNHPDSADISANFSSTMNWSYDLTGKPVANKYDLVSVVLHEIGHGLGFFDSYTVSGSEGYLGIDNDGYPMIFDLYLENSVPQNLFFNFAAPSATLRSQLVGNKIFFNSPQALTSNSGNPAKIYAPTTFSAGSSISHLDENTFAAGNPNSLMTPSIGAAEVMHDPGPIVNGIFSDIGWVFTLIDHNPIQSTENINASFVVKATALSDVGSVANMTLHYNTGGSDIVLPMALNGSEYSATIPTTNSNTTYSYYISADDALRSYTLPGKLYSFNAGITQTYYSFTAAPDATPPVITHNAEKVILNTTDTLVVAATITDNLRIELVTIDYFINDVDQISQSLPVKANNIYSFKLPLETLNIGDVIKYRITARDVAVIGNANGNVAYSPSSTEYHVVNVTGLQEPRDYYTNDFNTESSDDFFGTGFTITTPEGFSTDAIHSDHPYKEGQGSPNDEVNLTYELLVPITIKADDATIRFDEIVLVEPGKNGAKFGFSEFYDYVVVEGSLDGGITWEPVADGYDSNNKPDWLTRYSSSTDAVGDASLYKPREINLLTKYTPGQEVVFRFRLYSDPLTAGWGWAIDNLRIQMDETPPLVLHNHIDYILPSNLILPMHVKSTDLSGIQDLSIEYIIKKETYQYTIDIKPAISEYNIPMEVSGTAGDTIQYRIISTDNAGNITTLPSSGYINAIVFVPNEAVATYENDFNSTSNDFIGNFYSIDKPTGFSDAMINTQHSYQNGFGVDQTSLFSYMLTTPIIINANNPYINFNEVVIVESHASIVNFGNVFFNDYVVVQGSADGGVTWKNFSDGYDAVAQSTWLNAFNSNKAGTSTMYKSRTINMVNNTGFQANDHVLVRFSMFTNATLNGWGWAIDNLTIQGAITGVPESISDQNFRIYPNPATNKLNVVLENNPEPVVALNLINMQGASLLSENYASSGKSFQHEVNTADLPQGMYLIKVTTTDKTYVKKFIKK